MWAHDPIQARRDEIHIWLTYLDEIDDNRLHVAYRALLSQQELDTESRFHFPADRRRYVVTRALVRSVLSRYVPMAPASWVFSHNAYGRPQIANSSGAHLSFNISHTRNLIVLALTKRRALGVDVENFRARDVALEVAEQILAPEEFMRLAALPPGDRSKRFMEYWTFKESYIKARGMGLAIPLEGFWFTYPEDCVVEIAIDSSLNDDPGRWQFWQFRLRPQYLMAICAERSEVTSSLIIREVIPGVAESVIVPDLLRASADKFPTFEQRTAAGAVARRDV
ncbi:MAG TPA: 4'-phosphopantetheinyl transferase superfamily protein [Gammaproteobacteria bacterium]|nr:4'-phosphopantetheinyl transferase superfamily protein [Gammaproteobacteria bacterium]